MDEHDQELSDHDPALSDRLEAVFAESRRAWAEGDPERAARLAEEAYAGLPEPRERWGYLSQIVPYDTARRSIQAGDPVLARRWLERARAAYGDDVDAARSMLGLLEGIICYHEGDLDRAFAWFKATHDFEGHRPFRKYDPAYLRFYQDRTKPRTVDDQDRAVISVDGRTHDEFPVSMAVERIDRLLSLMDGVDPSAVNLWRLPQATHIDDVDLDDDQPFIQCAGSADAMVVELQLHPEAGAAAREHWILGRAAPTGAADQEVAWDAEDSVMEVHAEEVFTAPEAARLVAEFLRHGDVTSEVHRRPIALEHSDADDGAVLTEEDGRRLLELAEAGNTLADADDFAGALVPWRQALAMLPEPVEQWDDGLWFLGSVGDACVAAGEYAEAERVLRRCFSYEEGRGSGLIWLRLGQAKFEQGELDGATDSLIAAYMLEGEEIFEDEDPKYRQLLVDRSLI